MNEKYDAHSAQVELAKVFSSVTLLGPPMNDKLVRLVAHLFSPEEAEVAIHLPFYYPKPLAKVAKKAKRVPELIAPILQRMSERRVIYGGEKGYSLMPLIPGMFEYMLMNGADSEWHRKYAELLVDMFSSGYVRSFGGLKIPAVRNIPVQAAIESKNHVVDSDLLSEMIDYHDDLAVANVCQCRQSMHFVGKDCKRAKPEDGCLIFGSFARSTVDIGSGYAVSKEQMRDIATERWEKKLVFMTANVSPQSPNAICTCCDCCCHALETINHYDGKTLVAPSHFIVEVDESLCNNCGKCARACNTHAHVMDNKKHFYEVDKCIGCGVCVALCKEGALSMVENPEYKEPAKGFAQLAVKLLPATALTGLKTKLTR